MDLHFLDWPESQSSGKRLALYFIDWFWSLAKSSFIGPYKQQDFLFADFLECWQFGSVRKMKKNKTCRAVPLKCYFSSILIGSTHGVFHVSNRESEGYPGRVTSAQRV